MRVYKGGKSVATLHKRGTKWMLRRVSGMLSMAELAHIIPFVEREG